MAKGYYLVVGDETTCGGVITEGEPTHTIMGEPSPVNKTVLPAVSIREPTSLSGTFPETQYWDASLRVHYTAQVTVRARQDLSLR